MPGLTALSLRRDSERLFRQFENQFEMPRASARGIYWFSNWLLTAAWADRPVDDHFTPGGRFFPTVSTVV